MYCTDLFTEEDDYTLMREAWVTSKLSPCKRTKVGAVISDCISITPGYCGHENCERLPCLREHASSGEDLHKCRGVHAEVKALLRHYTSPDILYVTHSPCMVCANMLVYAGVGEVVYDLPRDDWEVSKKILEDGGVKVRRYHYVPNENPEQANQE